MSHKLRFYNFPLVIFLFLLCLNETAFAQRLNTAFDYFQKGEYEKALSEFEAAAKDKNLAFVANLGIAKVNIETGQYDQAEAACRKALNISAKDPEALNLLGLVLKHKGDYDGARAKFQEAFELNSNHLASRLNLGKMQWEWGEKKLARQTLSYFIAHYRSQRNFRPEELNLIARACVYLDRVRDANDFFYNATDADKNLWQAYIPWGNLLLSKYNIPDARSIFADALKINPNSSDARLGMAKCFRSKNFERAREEAKAALGINPNLIEAHNFLGELEIALGKFETALETLARPLEINPNSFTTRTLRAVCFYFLDEEKKYEDEVAKILAINPKYGDLYFQIAEVLAKRYLFQETVEFYKKALSLDPEHWLARAGLGTSLSRLGKEEAAKAELEKAFASDPFNKYVGNLLTLFDEFPQYKTFQTEKFVMRIHEKDAPVLADYAIALAEESLTELSKKYSFDITEPVIIEIFPEHDDFAVRCFGLPGAQAFLGICFGNVVAMDSPRARSKGDFVWGETLWHELVHVTHLKMTANRIPRWLAEGIAVFETTLANPYWQLNLDIPFIMAFKNKQLLALKDLDSGFNRPTTPGQVTMSYFQASKIVEFIVDKYGHNKLVAMFPKFKSGMKTPGVISDVFGKDVDSFDEEFRDYITQSYQLENVDYSFNPHEMRSDGDSEDLLANKISTQPNNPFLNFRFGLYYKEKKDYEKAIPYLNKAKELYPNYVASANPYEALAEIYLESGKKDAAITELKQLTSLNGKNIEVLNELGDLCIEIGDTQCALDAFQKILYITPFTAEVHKKLADVYLTEGKFDLAIKELRTNLLTEPRDLAAAHCDLANALLQAGRKVEAKKSVLAALEIAPNYERAQEILLATIE